MALSFALNQEQKDFLSRQAHLAIQSVFDGHEGARPLWPDPECCDAHSGLPLSSNLGSFVTLTLAGDLRGCIGTITAQEPLYLNVWNMARQAAFNDPRFPPLTPGEWARVKMEISVLDQPALCPDPAEIVVGRDGLILVFRGSTGVFLPQVPVEQGWNREQYLNHLCLKAGVPQGSWQEPDAKIYWYQALVFPA